MEDPYRSPQLSIHLFGRFEVESGGQPIWLRSDSDRALLAYLTVESVRAHERTAVAELLWPHSSPKTANDNLRTTLAQVRKAIGNKTADPPFIPIQPRMLQFDRASDYQLDVDAFRLATSAIGLLPDSVAAYDDALVERLQAAVERYNGRFLAGFSLTQNGEFEIWRESRAEFFHHQVMDFLRALVAYALHYKQTDVALRYALRQIELMPENEDAHRTVMRLYAMAGQTEQALAQFAALQHELATLDAKPSPDVVALYEQILAGRAISFGQLIAQTPGGTTSAAHPTWSQEQGRQDWHPLSQVGLPCFGREREREKIGQLLRYADGRLLTLLGIGGVGKTRLALQVGEDCADAFPDGVFFVSLAAVEGFSALVTATAVAVGFPFQEGGDPLLQFLHHLRDKRMLLVLDNFEHLIHHRSFIERIMAQTEQLKLLVTSRERLGVEEERSLYVGELAYPPTGEERWLESYPAVALFVYCARLIDADFQLTAENRRDVATICQLVAGLPLGVRLAAALTRLHAPRQIALDLARHLDFPQGLLPGIPKRQHTIGAVFAYSWQRLRVEEQRAMCRLSVFSGGFTWEAAQAVCDPGQETLLALVDKSLVSRNSFERFEIHELIRRQAQQRLESEPFAAETRQRHAHFYLAFLQARAAAIAQDEPTAVKDVVQEIENLRTGWLWALQHKAEIEIETYVALLGQFYQQRHRYQDALELYERTFAHLPIGLETSSANVRTTHLSVDSGMDLDSGRIRRTGIGNIGIAAMTAHWQRLWGEALYKSGQMQESRRHLLRAVEALDRPLPRGRFSVPVATCVELLRQIAHRMWPAHRFSRADSTRREVWLEAARTHERLGQIFYFANQSEQAVYTAIRGLNLAERCGPSSVLARLYANMCLGVATIPALRTLPALYGRLALDTARVSGHEPSLGWTLELVGMYRTGIADWSAAQSLIEQSVEIHARTGNPRHREEGLAVLAFIQQCHGHFDRALETWRCAFHSAFQRGDRQVQMWSLSGIVENLMMRGEETRLDQALPDQVIGLDIGVGTPAARIQSLLEQANQLYIAIDDKAAQISAYGFLALIALRIGDDRVALEWAHVALALMQTASSMTFSNVDGYSAVAEVFLTLYERTIGQETPQSVRAQLAAPVQAACNALQHYARVFPVAQPHALRWQARLCKLQRRDRRAARLWQSGIRCAAQFEMPYVRTQIEQDRAQWN